MDISWPRWRHFPRNKINIQNEIKLNVQSRPARDPELLPGAAASGYFGTPLPSSLLLTILLAGVPSINVAHLILCSFLFHFAFAAAPVSGLVS